MAPPSEVIRKTRKMGPSVLLMESGGRGEDRKTLGIGVEVEVASKIDLFEHKNAMLQQSLVPT